MRSKIRLILGLLGSSDHGIKKYRKEDSAAFLSETKLRTSSTQSRHDCEYDLRVRVRVRRSNTHNIPKPATTASPSIVKLLLVTRLAVPTTEYACPIIGKLANFSTNFPIMRFPATFSSSSNPEGEFFMQNESASTSPNTTDVALPLLYSGLRRAVCVGLLTD